MRDWIELEDFTVDCVIGVLSEEQCATQPVRVSLRLGLDLEAAAGGDLSKGVDYAAVAAQVGFVLRHGRWRLLESAAFAIARLLLAPPAPCERRAVVEEVDLRLRKPRVLPDATPGVRIGRDALWCDLETRMVPPRTWVDVLQETPQVGAWRVHVEAGSRWSVPASAAAFVLGAGLLGDGRALAVGERVARGAVAEIANTGPETASLIVLSNPGLGT